MTSKSTVTLTDQSSNPKLNQFEEPVAKDIYSKSAPITVFPPSLPTAPGVHKVASEVKPLAHQTSAPFYLFSLNENEAPPFSKPGKMASPQLLVGSIMNEEEAIEMIAAVESDRALGLKVYMDGFLVKKKILQKFNLSEKSFLTSLISEVIDYSASKDFNAFKLSTLIGIYLDTHLFFKWNFWSSPTIIWEYFKEVMVRHTIEDSPHGQEVFQPDECYDIITQFHTIYLSNLPLIHILTFGVYRLKFNWPHKVGNK